MHPQFFNTFNGASKDFSKINMHYGEDTKVFPSKTTISWLWWTLSQFSRARGTELSYTSLLVYGYTRWLIQFLLTIALSVGVYLQTNTAVIDTLLSELGVWKVVTSVGDITAFNVFRATNRYCSNILPEMTSIVVPLLGNVTAIPPTTAFDQRPLASIAVFV